MEVSLLQVGAFGILAYFLYKACCQSLPNKSIGKVTRPGEIGSVTQFQETADAAVDPLKERSDKNYSKVLRREEGEFGTPRTLYLGTGSIITAYGDNFNAL
jgi:hypothetical protein